MDAKFKYDERGEISRNPLDQIQSDRIESRRDFLSPGENALALVARATSCSWIHTRVGGISVQSSVRNIVFNMHDIHDMIYSTQLYRI